MSEVFIYMLEHLGAPALILLFGYCLDELSTPVLKDTVRKWIKRKSKVEKPSAQFASLLRLFLSGFMDRIFGSKLFSAKFLIRSSLVTVIFLLLTIAIQYFYYEDALSDQFVWSGRPFSYSVTVFLVFLTINLLIDLLSNAQTIALINLAAKSGRFADFVLVIWADLILTLTIFTFLFPLGILANFAFVGISKPETIVSVQLANPELTESFLKYDRPLFDVSGLTFHLLEISSNVADESLDKAYLKAYSTKDTTNHDLLEKSVEIIRAKTRLTILKDSDSAITLQVDVPPNFSLNFFKTLYYSAYKEANVTREGFLGLIALAPVVIRAESVLSPLGYLAERVVKNTTAICRDGRKEFFQINVSSPDSEKPRASCEAAVVFSENNRSDDPIGLRALVYSKLQFPVTPFFLTSFASSILYYSAILLVYLGMFMLRIMRLTVTTPYLKNVERPFVLLSIACYPFVVLIGFAWRLL